MWLPSATGITDGNGTLLAGGAAGDFSTMTWRNVLRLPRRCATRRTAVPIAMGAQTTSTRELKQLASSGQAGLEYIQVSCPFYFNHTEEDFFEYVRPPRPPRRSASSSTTRSGPAPRCRSNGVRLAEIPNVVGLKWATPRTDAMEFEDVVSISRTGCRSSTTISCSHQPCPGRAGLRGASVQLLARVGLRLLELNARRHAEVQRMLVREAMPFYKLWAEIERTYTSGDGYLDKLCMELVGLDRAAVGRRPVTFGPSTSTPGRSRSTAGSWAGCRRRPAAPRTAAWDGSAAWLVSVTFCASRTSPSRRRAGRYRGGRAGGAGRDRGRADPRGHKVALRDLRDGAVVSKFGLPIGAASARIKAGAHVHTHNLAFRASTAPASRRSSQPAQPAARGATFDGYGRADGRVGTRNVLLVLATVNCSATVARRIAERFRAAVDLAGASVDGVVALTHQHGCSVRADGPGMDLLRRTLAGYARHPNVAGVLVVGLGCEDNQVDEFLAASGLTASERLAVRIIQDEGGTARPSPPGSPRWPPCCLWPRRRGARRCRRRIWWSGCNAAARTGSRPSPPIRRWAMPPTCWWRRAAPSSFRKPRRSTAPRACCWTGRPIRRSPPG